MLVPVSAGVSQSWKRPTPEACCAGYAPASPGAQALLERSLPGWSCTRCNSGCTDRRTTRRATCRQDIGFLIRVFRSLTSRCDLLPFPLQPRPRAAEGFHLLPCRRQLVFLRAPHVFGHPANPALARHGVGDPGFANFSHATLHRCACRSTRETSSPRPFSRRKRRRRARILRPWPCAWNATETRVQPEFRRRDRRMRPAARRMATAASSSR